MHETGIDAIGFYTFPMSVDGSELVLSKYQTGAFWLAKSSRLLSKLYYCCKLLCCFGAQILTYWRACSGFALRCALHFATSSEFREKPSDRKRYYEAV